ncbi:MAG TPA: tRNA (adenosine(37)-N6)-threonylcarbamoyltransferase complex ATPase subunit type 1 TsaE [Opitutaceae bacterium]|nr:tRNA (adenosine(37)-N6)-threonylcarbamoyltransferase complex ATPase subunit type 1 TsaE [Opitutaceae bacterium]
MNLHDRLRAGIITTHAAATQACATELAATLPDDCTLALHGNLGVGKTTFVQGLARGLGINDSVTSPTFNIFTLYRGPRWTLLHLDAYRLESPEQIEALMIEDFLVSPWCLAVEWPEKISAWIPANAFHLDFGITKDEAHTLQLRPSTS